MDSFYTSLHFLSVLKETGIGAWGTVSENRKNFPRQFLSKSQLKMNKGDMPAFAISKENDIVTATWPNSQRCHLLPTVDGNDLMDKTVRAKGYIWMGEEPSQNQFL